MSAFTPLRKHAATTIASAEDRDMLALHQLTEKLHLIEQRLGTPAEQPDDENLARELGHDIRNRLNVLQLREEFRELMLVKDHVLEPTA